MAMAAKSFGRRPREEAVATKPAASLGAVLELLRALNWFIRADIPWPTQRGQVFDFVLAGESGVFAMWMHEGEPAGVVDAAAELGRLLGGVSVRPVVCRATSSLTQADSGILFCTPETALDLLVGLPAYMGQTPIPTIVNRLRELVVPLPPE
ncbi:MAG TPA: hypothetical protein VN108_00470, partial [Marmoricola sp.]|nr:hypothetical protein [Marmoricola sp.]